ncbi:PTS sugar transporter subunit IIA [Lederbergia sp. NSJ-179]|uniref:PTS sugar transporter subunit IIA n=1 Tax=Lederbergia sp. NSJ-179 TaxID=2931402 RepID=UPI001FD3B0F6|nr:PTS sugar transporter subunit IIA [Lederbergia sp. NSJ-179]MCJ7843249.1 PTS sugar transporter subunit IIA [Lederbergia sp. NSJ-179]
MRYFLFASHGNFADGILHSLELITGKHENIWTINAYVNDGEDLNGQISEVMKRLEAEDELIVVTDIFGGSVNNEFMKLIHDRRMTLIAGLNLPLIMELTMNQQMEDTDKLVKLALDRSKDSIQHCRLDTEQEKVDDDF